MSTQYEALPPPKQRLLFVDDEEAIRITLPAVLENEGFDVTVSGSVPEAFELINHQPFQVLLTDLNIGNPARWLHPGQRDATDPAESCRLHPDRLPGFPDRTRGYSKTSG